MRHRWLVLAATGAFFHATSAPAQEMYDWSIPANRSTVSGSPNTITIRFTEGIYFKDVHLFATEGHVEWPLEWARNEEDIFEVVLKPAKTLPTGRYEIEWWADVRQHFHPDGGVIVFTVGPAVP